MIFYWEGILSIALDSTKYSDVLNKLREGQLLSAQLDLKKLPGYKVYTVRINDADRLLFTTISRNNKSYLLLLDVILNHDYQKCSFLKPQVLKRFLEKNHDVLEEQIQELDHIDETTFHLETTAPFAADLESDALSPLSYYNHLFIELNTEQQQFISTPLPAIISGAPGSGKSCVAFSALVRAAKEWLLEPELNSLPLLYVTESAFLARTLNSYWQELPLASLLGERVQFLSFEDVFLKTQPQLAQWKQVGQTECLKWLKKALHKYQHTAVHNFYQEFRIISGFDSEQEYLTVGKRHTVLANKEEQSLAWKLAQHYQHELSTKQEFNLALLKSKPTAVQYARIFADESQDLSYSQLIYLRDLALNRQIGYCLDSHQSLADNLSKIPYLQMILNQHTSKGWLEVPQLQLSYTLRCSRAINEQSNRVLGIKNHLIAGTAHKNEPVTIDDAPSMHDEGLVQWIDKPALKEFIQRLSMDDGSTHFAVVTLPAFVNEARERFKTPLVFTIEQIKGFEYDTVCVYKLISDELFAEASALLSDENITSLHQHRPKQLGVHTRFGPQFNMIYCAMMRAKSTLLIYEEPRHSINKLIEKLNPNAAHPLVPIPMPAPSYEAEWQQEALRLSQRPETQEQAQRIRSRFKPREASGTKQNPKKSKEAQPQTEPSIDPFQIRKIKTKAKLAPHQTKSNLEPSSSASMNRVRPHPVPKNSRALNDTLLANEFIYLVQKSEPFISIIVSDLSFLIMDKEYKQPMPLLYWVALYGEENLLSPFITKELDMSKSITQEALCHGLNQHAGADANTSAFYWLSGTLSGQQLLNQLIELCPKIATLITQEALCAIRNNQAGADAYTSAFYWLCASEYSRAILTKIFTLNPALIKLITTDALCSQRAPFAGADAYTSAFYWLATSPDGRKLLSFILNIYPDFAKLITCEALYATQNELAGTYANIPPFAYLDATNHQDGLLALIQEINPALIPIIHEESVEASSSNPTRLGKNSLFNASNADSNTENGYFSRCTIL